MKLEALEADGKLASQGLLEIERSWDKGYDDVMRMITLTTDFGFQDWFVGTLRGVIASISPEVQVVDITHGVAPGDVTAGAYALAQAAPWFPAGTIHVAVIDPGVGSERKAVVVRTPCALWIGPDNGLLGLAVGRCGGAEVRELTNTTLMLTPRSRTFHGRDVFAPAAAHLAAGFPFEKVGPLLGDLQRKAISAAESRPGELWGAVLYVDRFGNGLTNLEGATLDRLGWNPDRVEIWLGKRRIGLLRSHYGAVPVGSPLALLGSSGGVEIALNQGSAADRLGFRVGSRVRARLVSLKRVRSD